MNNKFKSENENEIINEGRTTVSVSRTNFLTLKKLGHALESNSIDETISKILAKQQGVYHINV